MLDALVKFLRHSKRTIVLILIIVVITLVASATISVWLETLEGVHIPSIGTLRIIGFEAYGGDLKINAGKQYLDWGRVDTGSSTNRSFFIRSKINNQTTLKFATENWTFLRTDNVSVTGNVLGDLTSPLENFMNATWDHENKPIPPGGVVNVTITLRVSSDYPFVSVVYANQVESFNFDISIEPKE